MYAIRSYYDLTTRRLVDKIDHQATYINAITSSCPEAVRIPPYFESDREALEVAFKTIGDIKSENARIVHIRDTLHLEEMYISEPMLPEVESRITSYNVCYTKLLRLSHLAIKVLECPKIRVLLIQGYFIPLRKTCKERQWFWMQAA